MPSRSETSPDPQSPAPKPKGPAPRPRYWELAALTICMAGALSLCLIPGKSKQAPAEVPPASPAAAPVAKAAPAPAKPESLPLILPPAQESSPAKEEAPRPSADSSGLVPYEEAPAEPAPKAAAPPMDQPAPPAAKPPAQDDVAPSAIPVKVAGPPREVAPEPSPAPAQEQPQAEEQARPPALPVPQPHLMQRAGPVQPRQPSLLRTPLKPAPAQPPVPAEPAAVAEEPKSPPYYCHQMAPVAWPGNAPAPAAEGWLQGTDSLRLLGGCRGLFVQAHLLGADHRRGYLNPDGPPVFYVYEFRNHQDHPVRYVADGAGRSWDVNVKPGRTVWLRWTRRLANH
ncbi:MAG: hypothetical protein NTY77_04020 [Elusimicrobia bacterium]|nr:hypothetical protein [Elusimicrobiota bacterium]